MESLSSFTVVAAVISDDDGRVLLTRRPDGKHMGGLWEFPGGKIEEGESPAEALVREIREELCIKIEIGGPITFAVHEETDLRILLLFFSARMVSGEPVGDEGQAVAWVSPRDLPAYPTPPADADLIEHLRTLDPSAGQDLP